MFSLSTLISKLSRAKIIGSFKLQVSLWLADLNCDQLRWQKWAAFEKSWFSGRRYFPRLRRSWRLRRQNSLDYTTTAPPPNLTRLLHNTASYAGWVCRTAHLPRDSGLTTYITKIRPVLEYASPVWGGLPIYLEEDLQRVQNRCLNVIGLPRDTVESLVIERQNLTRKEFKRMLESEAHPCKRFLEKPVDHGHNLRSCKTNPAHLRIPVSRTVRHKQSFIPRGAKLNLIWYVYNYNM